MSKLSGIERINMLSVNPCAATVDDIAGMAAILSDIYKNMQDLNPDFAKAINDDFEKLL